MILRWLRRLLGRPPVPKTGASAPAAQPDPNAFRDCTICALQRPIDEEPTLEDQIMAWNRIILMTPTVKFQPINQPETRH